MTRSAIWLASVAVLFVAQAWLRPVLAAPSSDGAPESSLSVLAGAARPMLVAFTWLEAQAALDDRRVPDALDRLRLLEGLDPSGWEASLFRAHIVAHNLAEREPPETRADRIVEAVRMLQQASARTRDPGPDVALGQLMLESRMWDPALASRLTRALGSPPRALALAALEEAERRDPSSDLVLRLEMEAARLAAFERLIAGGSFAEFAAGLDRAASLAGRVAQETVATRLAESWARLARAALNGTSEAIERAGEGLSATLTAWERAAPRSDELEAALAGAFVRAGVPLARERLRQGDARAALSLVTEVLTIRRLVVTRLNRSSPDVVRSLADSTQLQGLLDAVSAADPSLETLVSAQRERLSAW